MSERESIVNNKALSDVESLILLLSDLKIIDSENPKKAAVEDINAENEELEIRSRLGEIAENLSVEPNIEYLDLKRSPSAYPFPSLLDELPFLRDIKPFKLNGFEENHSETLKKENLNFANDSEYLASEKTEEEIETINLIQKFFLDNQKPQLISQFIPQPQLENISDVSLEDARALHLLQDILVIPEKEDLQSFKMAVEQKLGIVEKQVNNPELLNKIKGLENLIQKASLDLGNLRSKLTKIGNTQVHIPMEIARTRDRLAQLEHHIYEPEELIKLLLPIVAELLSAKASQSRKEMCQAIMPIIAEVIFERSQLDRMAMSRAIADILPNAISEQIRNRPDEIAKAIAPEIGAAISEQIRLDRDAIVEALAPEMSAAIKRQIVLERDSMVDALYPVIGNTIAKYLGEAIRSINEKVEKTFSVEGLQRKVRAKMQGVSEAELIIKESVPFEVQAIFLIHNLSGLIMIDIQQSNLDSLVDPIDSDMLAGMLTAIRSFASECMSRSSSNTELDAINYSGSKILLEVAGYCYLAVIIRGEPSPAFSTKIRDVFGQIVQAYGDRLKQFDGDPSVIPLEVESELRPLMEFEPNKPSKKSSKPLIFIGLAIFTLIFVPIGIYQYQSSRDRQLEAKVLESFANTPELAVYRLNVTANGDQLKLAGKLPNQYLRDRALQVATETVKAEIKSGEAIGNIQNNIQNNIYAVNVPPDPTIISTEVQRLTKVLNYTQGVKINSQFKDGQVTITGQIEQPSLMPKITQTYSKIDGVTTVNNAAMILIPKLSTRIYFPFGVTSLQPTDLQKLVEIQTFLNAYPDFNIKIFTKSDNVGDRNINYQLGIKRCQAVRDALVKRGVNVNRLHISGIIETFIEKPSDQLARWVEFEPALK